MSGFLLFCFVVVVVIVLFAWYGGGLVVLIVFLSTRGTPLLPWIDVSILLFVHDAKNMSFAL